MRTIGGTPMFGARVVQSSKPSRKSSRPSANLASFDSKADPSHPQDHHHDEDDDASDRGIVKKDAAEIKHTPSVPEGQVDSARIHKDWVLGHIGTEVQAEAIEGAQRSPPLVSEHGITRTKTFQVHRV